MIFLSKSIMESRRRSDKSDLSFSVNRGYAHPKAWGVTKFTVAVHRDRTMGDKGDSVEDLCTYIVQVLRKR